MKKVLVAGAALMLAGSMVSAASAEVNLSGDARVRYIGMSSDLMRVKADLSGTEQSDYRDEFDSRIRVKFDAKAKGGAFMKARLRLDDISAWGTGSWSTDDGWDAHKESKNVWADYAYIGVPMGPVVVTGGRMPANFSTFFSWDKRPTRLKADYNAGKVRVIGIIDVKDEVGLTAEDVWDDNDFMGYGLVASFKINDDNAVKGYVRYHDDERGAGLAGFEDRSGWLGSVNYTGKAAMVGLEAELAYKEADVLNNTNTAGTRIDDDGFGGFVQASLDMGAFTPAVQLGFTQDGYQADINFGFIMIGADEPITAISTLGLSGGNTYWAALTSGYQVSEQFKLAGNLVYYDIDINDNALENADDIRGAMDAWEISGSATYTVSEGADLTYKLGYLDQSYDGRLNAAGLSEDGIFGHYLRLAIKF